MPAPLLVVVTGNPGVGKSTLARRLADELRLPLLAKDAIKERLGDVLGPPADRAASQALGRATMLVLFDVVDELLRGGQSVIVESNFYGDAAERLRGAIAGAGEVGGAALATAASRRERAAGRPLAPESPEDGGVRVVQVLVECPPALAAERYAARTRHPVHVLTEIGELPPLDPLDLPGDLVRVDTTQVPVDLAPILEVIVNWG